MIKNYLIYTSIYLVYFVRFTLDCAQGNYDDEINTPIRKIQTLTLIPVFITTIITIITTITQIISTYTLTISTAKLPVVIAILHC